MFMLDTSYIFIIYMMLVYTICIYHVQISSTSDVEHALGGIDIDVDFFVTQSRLKEGVG